MSYVSTTVTTLRSTVKDPDSCFGWDLVGILHVLVDKVAIAGDGGVKQNLRPFQ